MKIWLAGAYALFSMQLVAIAGDLPAVLAKYFDAKAPIKAQLIEVTPPAEFEPFVQKLSEAAQKDPVWYAEHSKKTPAGSPIPLFDEKLGMTQLEYDKYVKFWDNREVRKLTDLSLIIKEVSGKAWKINGSGPASALSLLSYSEATNSFKSPNGELVAIADVSAPSASLLGAWNGNEWRYLSENSLTKGKENVALGKSADGNHGFLIYRIQEATSAGRPLFDKSLMIRFAVKKQ